jgi:hypothetical protein
MDPADSVVTLLLLPVSHLAVVQNQPEHMTDIRRKAINGHPMRGNSNGHVMIAVDTIYPPDMSPSIDDDHRNNDKHGGYHMLSAKHADLEMVPRSQGDRYEPVVDLSVPVHQQAAHDYQRNLALSAPRQGQDIFDTWCAPVPP